MDRPVDRLTTALAGRYRIERELGAGGMVADDGRSYTYFTATYNSLLFSIEGVR